MISTFAAMLILGLSDPNNLTIGRPGSRVLPPNTITDMRTGNRTDAAGIARRAEGLRFVFLGENHATAPHQNLHASVVEELDRAGRHVTVGVEMLTRPKQAILDAYISGTISESEFLTDVDWKGQWGYDWAYYRPLFEMCRLRGIRMVALNVPRDWVRAVGRGGFDALTPEQRSQLPARMALDVAGHREVFNSLMGGHAPTGASAENMYAAQVLWDEAMADSALKASFDTLEDRDSVFVVIAGSGHMLYGQGINMRIARRTGIRGLNVAMMQSETPVTVANGLADVVFVSGKP